MPECTNRSIKIKKRYLKIRQVFFAFFFESPEENDFDHFFLCIWNFPKIIKRYIIIISITFIGIIHTHHTII